MRLSPVSEPSLRAQLQHFMTHVNTVVTIPSLLSSSDQHDMQVRPQCGSLLGALQALGTQLPGLAGLTLQGAMGTLCQGQGQASCFFGECDLIACLEMCQNLCSVRPSLGAEDLVLRRPALPDPHWEQEILLTTRRK